MQFFLLGCRFRCEALDTCEFVAIPRTRGETGPLQGHEAATLREPATRLDDGNIEIGRLREGSALLRSDRACFQGRAAVGRYLTSELNGRQIADPEVPACRAGQVLDSGKRRRSRHDERKAGCLAAGDLRHEVRNIGALAALDAIGDRRRTASRRQGGIQVTSR